MPLAYRSCFALALRGIHGKVDICQTDYNTTLKPMKGCQRLNENDQLLSLMFLFFLSFCLFQCPR